MKMNQFRVIGLLVIISLMSCYDTSSIKDNNKREHRVLNKSERKAAPTNPTHALWDSLLFEAGGCLTGGQYVKSDDFGGMGCIMSTSMRWATFFETDSLAEFLIDKITNDTTKTKIHTCPFFNATEAEVAVYALQSKYKVNWYDFEEFKQYQNRTTEGSADNHQAWLQEIINEDYSRSILKEGWRNIASRKQ